MVRRPLMYLTLQPLLLTKTLKKMAGGNDGPPKRRRTTPLSAGSRSSSASVGHSCRRMSLAKLSSWEGVERGVTEEEESWSGD